MADLEQEVRRRYLDRLDDSTWSDYDPSLDFGICALPYFVAAFEKEADGERRARLVRVIWQFRDLAALPTLAIALRDPRGDVWKDALDGLVALGGNQALMILNEARAAAPPRHAEAEKIEWIDEAATQVTKGM